MARTNKIPADYGSEDLQDEVKDKTAALHASRGTHVIASRTKSNGNAAAGGKREGAAIKARGGNS